MRRSFVPAQSPLDHARPAAPRPAVVANRSASTSLHRLQHAIGNRGAQRFLRDRQDAAAANPPQPVGIAGSAGEREANHVADGLRNVDARRVRPVVAPRTATPPVVNDALRSPGRPLDASSRELFEPLFGKDFNSVRIHTDDAAAESARGIDAQAYTVGRDIVFGAGYYAPDTDEGKRLLAHELTHVVQQEESHRLQAKAVETSGLSSDQDRSELLGLLDDCEVALDGFFARYRKWLTHNMIAFVGDVSKSGKADKAMASVNSGFGEGVLKEAVVNAISLGAIELGTEYGGKQFAKYFLTIRAAKVVGGVFSFIVGAILEYLVGGLFDNTAAIIQATGDRIDALVNGTLNPVVDGKLNSVRKSIQQSRNDFAKLALAHSAWEAEKKDILELTKAAGQALPDVNDFSLYRKAALMAKVFSGGTVVAEDKAPGKMTSAGGSLGFVIQHKELKKPGQTKIVVVKDNSKVVLRLRSFDCLKDESGEVDPVDIKTDGPNAWRNTPPASEYLVELYQPGFFVDSTISIPRVFQVGKEQYGIWYNVPTGTYFVYIWGRLYHPVALCGTGQYWVEAPA